MGKIFRLALTIIMGVFISSTTMLWTEAEGQEVLRYSSSAQVHDVLLEDTLQAFTK